MSRQDKMDEIFGYEERVTCIKYGNPAYDSARSRRDSVHEDTVTMCKITETRCIGFSWESTSVSCANCMVPLLYPDEAKKLFAEEKEEEIKRRRQTAKEASNLK